MSDIYKDWKEMPDNLEIDGHGVGLCQLGFPHEGKWAVECYVENNGDPYGFDNIHYIFPPSVQWAMAFTYKEGQKDARSQMRQAMGL